jgi:hypothetical protein
VIPLPLRIDTNECLSSRGVLAVPMPAAVVMARNERRMLPAALSGADASSEHEIVVLSRIVGRESVHRLLLAVAAVAP